jgi:hypothetical protein
MESRRRMMTILMIEAAFYRSRPAATGDCAPGEAAGKPPATPV